MSLGPPWSYRPCFQRKTTRRSLALLSGPGCGTNRTRRAFSLGSEMIQPAPRVVSGMESLKAEKAW